VKRFQFEMVDLFLLSARELISNWRQALKTFVPTLAVLAVLAFLVFLMAKEFEANPSQPPSGLHVGMTGAIPVGLVIVVLLVSEALVRWHRFVLLREQPKWTLPKASLLALSYSWRTVLFLIGFVVVSKVAESAFDDLLMPVAGLWFQAVYFRELVSEIWIGRLIGELLLLAIYLLTFARLLLRLPSVAPKRAPQPKSCKRAWTSSWLSGRPTHFLIS
jgi:hypothetical protein